MISRLSEGLSRNTFSVSVMLLLFRLNFHPQIKKYLDQSLLFSGKSGPESDGASDKQYDEFLHYLYVFGFE